MQQVQPFGLGEELRTPTVGTPVAPPRPGLTALDALALGQGVYFALTGVWSLLHIRSFMAVTGPKVDVWLVKAVGALVTAIGGTLVMAGVRRNRSPEIPTLAVGSAVSLAAIDLVYVARRRISPVYLLDALAEAALVAVWARAWTGAHRHR